ncbi:ABC transporter, ATP-binding protein [Pseudoalteromonas luteoviolacea B = ATCC 29581]|nr:ABC transporter, ATP-binding protein [Pseudoalteromonas luteoviolacea B = ATCC 29581]
MDDPVALIKLKGLHKSFKAGGQETVVLRHIDLAIYKGDFVAITGASGSGKSTLLSILGLLEQHDQGEYVLSGHPVNVLSRFQLAQLRNRHIGWIFQNFNLVQDMTVLENVMLPLSYQPEFSRTTALKVVEEAILEVGLKDKASFYPSQLSGGQQQRVAIARAIATHPDLILADEPTGNLDTQNSKIIFDLLARLHHQGRTVVMVTHDEKQAKMCPTQITLKDGEVINTRRSLKVIDNVV